jgi:hypothetical protein
MFTWLRTPTREQVNQVRREEVEDDFRDVLEDAASEPQHVMLQIASGIAMAQKVFAEKFPSFNDYAKQPKTVKAAFDAGLRDYAKRCGKVEPETAGGITIAGMFFTIIEMWGDNSIDRAQLDRSGNLLNQFMDNARLIPLSQVGPYVVSWPPAPVNRDGCKGAGRGEGTNSERISGWLSG